MERRAVDMNSELVGLDEIRHREATGLKKVAQLIKMGIKDATEIFDMANDYRARAIVMNLNDAMTQLDVVEMEIITAIKGIRSDKGASDEQ